MFKKNSFFIFTEMIRNIILEMWKVEENGDGYGVMYKKINR